MNGGKLISKFCTFHDACTTHDALFFELLSILSCRKRLSDILSRYLLAEKPSTLHALGRKTINLTRTLNDETVLN